MTAAAIRSVLVALHCDTACVSCAAVARALVNRQHRDVAILVTGSHAHRLDHRHFKKRRRTS